MILDTKHVYKIDVINMVQLVLQNRAKKLPQNNHFSLCLVNQNFLQSYLFNYRDPHFTASLLCSPTKFKRDESYSALYKHIYFDLIAKISFYFQLVLV